MIWFKDPLPYDMVGRMNGVRRKIEAVAAGDYGPYNKISPRGIASIESNLTKAYDHLLKAVEELRKAEEKAGI